MPRRVRYGVPEGVKPRVSLIRTIDINPFSMPIGVCSTVWGLGMALSHPQHMCTHRPLYWALGMHGVLWWWLGPSPMSTSGTQTAHQDAVGDDKQLTSP